MSKRFVDTDIWKHQWFSDLSQKQKLLWFYICTQCDGGGVWPINLRLAGASIGEDVTAEDVDALGLCVRIVRVSKDKLWITGFIKFQYKNLSPRNKAQLGIMRSVVDLVAGLPLEADSLDLITSFKSSLNRGSTEGQLTHLDTDTDTEKKTFTDTGTDTEGRAFDGLDPAEAEQLRQTNERIHRLRQQSGTRSLRRFGV